MDRLTSMGTFVKVVDSGGFSAAARRLSMSVTMVSNHVQALEEHLGARLLNRTTRSIALTETGRAYYERCTAILAEIEEADSAAGILHASPTGRLKFHANRHIMRYLTPVVRDYLDRYPQMTVDVTAGESVADLVEEGYDLVVQTVQPPNSPLISRNLLAWRHFLCASPEYLASHPPIATLSDLTRHNCLHYAFYPYGEEWRFTAPNGKPAAVRTSGNLVTNTADLLMTMARSGRGVFFAPSFLVEEDLASGRLVEILPAWRPVEFSISAIYPHRRRLSSKVRIFIDLMAEHFARHQRWLDMAAD